LHACDPPFFAPVGPGLIVGGVCLLQRVNESRQRARLF
jgi:hypothetical protein